MVIVIVILVLLVLLGLIVLWWFWPLCCMVVSTTDTHLVLFSANVYIMITIYTDCFSTPVTGNQRSAPISPSASMPNTCMYSTLGLEINVNLHNWRFLEKHGIYLTGTCGGPSAEEEMAYSGCVLLWWQRAWWHHTDGGELTIQCNPKKTEQKFSGYTLKLTTSTGSLGWEGLYRGRDAVSESQKCCGQNARGGVWRASK